MDYTGLKKLKIGQKWLLNELVIFLALKSCDKFQSNLIILSKVIVLTDDDKHCGKNHFFTQGISKRRENRK